MALTDLGRQWLHLTVEHNWCAGRSSVTPQIAGGQSWRPSKQCSAYWTLSDFPWLIFWASLMTSGGQRRAGSSDGGHTVHRKLLTSGTQRKHPNKHAGESVNRKIHKGRHLVQVHDAFRDRRTHSGSVWCFLYWHTVLPCFRMSCVRATDCIHHRVSLFIQNI